MPVGKIAILAAIRDCYEPYIRFWIDYHLGIGASHIFIYDNESLEPIPEYGEHVTVTRWPGVHGQLTAYRHGMVRISANVTGDFGNVTDPRLGAGLRG
ncbi:MAG: hypothetical protein HYZ20_11475 [Burkholderiales bacterium]|nr:hypothetical protein [Burkholderiales bacterium]